LSEKLERYWQMMSDAERSYDLARGFEKSLRGSSQSAFEKYSLEVKKAKDVLWKEVSENAGYALELQFQMYCDRSVLKKPIGDAMEELMLGRIKSILLSHE
jgi:hypothetical protein